MADLTRKNFMMLSELNPKLEKYSEEYNMSQAQVINLALKNFFDAQDLQKLMSSYTPEQVSKIVTEQLKSQFPEYLDKK